jgi:hypothetical protein
MLEIFPKRMNMAIWPLRIMVYGGGEAINGSNALAPQIQRQISDLSQVCTNSFVAATAQLDASDRPSRRLVLDPSGRQPELSLPNVNVGDPDSLMDFVNWSEAICPAERAVLVLSGHGSAWQDSQADAVLGLPRTVSASRLVSNSGQRGAVHHPRSLFGNPDNSKRAISRALLIDGHSRDYLSNAELGAVCEKIALRRGRPLDVIVFDACLMSSWEILQELSGSTCTVVASIDELSAAGIPLSGPAVKLTGRQGVDDPAGIAKSFAETFLPQADFDSCVAIDISAAAWGNALTMFRTCCEALLTWVQYDPTNAQALQKAMEIASVSVVQYQHGGLADVASLTEALAGLQGAPAAVTSNAASTAKALATCIIGHVAGHDYQRATGLSIFSPASRTEFIANRADYGRLRFPINTGWLAVLDAVFGYATDTARFAGMVHRDVPVEPV